MITSGAFIEAARDRGFGLYTGVPCSYLRPIIDHVIDAEELRYVAAANEGDAVAIAAGSELGGRRAVCMFQNSGLGNAISPLSSLTATFRIPALLVITHRGEPGRPRDEPQHELMGRITTDVLDLLGIGWDRLPSDPSGIDTVLDRADEAMLGYGRCHALIVSEGTVEGRPEQRLPQGGTRPLGPRQVVQSPISEPAATRAELLETVQRVTGPDDLLIATTGYTGRELYTLDDAPNQLYMVGSMGCAPSLGLGLAIARSRTRVIVLDGDGAALMRMGSLATIGAERPANLVHVLFDNGRHESTGGQRTVSDSTDLAAVAAACGYPRVERAATPEQLFELLDGGRDGPLFVHAPIRAGVLDPLPRPQVTPTEVAARVRAHLAMADSVRTV